MNKIDSDKTPKYNSSKINNCSKSTQMSAARKLHVTHIASGDLWAGAEVQLHTLVKALNKLEEVSVSVILLNHGTLEQKLIEIEIPVTVLDEARLNGLQIIWRIIKQLKQHQPDIVHTHRIKENILGGLAAKMVHIPSLRTVHGAPEHAPSWLRPHKRLFHLLDWALGRYLQSSIVAVSEDLKALLDKRFPDGKVHVIENGVDIEALAPFCKSLVENTNSTNPYKIGLVGRLVPVKRVDLFIQTADYLRKHQPEIQTHFHIYGDGPLRTELMELTKRLNVEDIVHFEGHRTDIHRQIASLDALMITSDHEGLPMTLLEVMTIGIPVVARAVGGITKVCNYGECCWLSDTNIGSIASKLNDCLRDKASRIAKIVSAQHQIKNNYSAFTITNLYVKHYIKIAKHAQSPF